MPALMPLRLVAGLDQQTTIIWHNAEMCGRFRLSRRKQVVMEHFDAISDEPEWEPRYNINSPQHRGQSQPSPVRLASRGQF